MKGKEQLEDKVTKRFINFLIKNILAYCIRCETLTAFTTSKICMKTPLLKVGNSFCEFFLSFAIFVLAMSFDGDYLVH